MNYEAVALAAILKTAREKKGLSQRQLSTLSGVPQSHISKIETTGVDLRISSLAGIANALGLEITLVPRKAMPAVRSISRSLENTPQVLPNVAKELANIANRLKAAKTLNIDASAVSAAQRHYTEIQQFQNLIKDTDALRHVSATMKAFTESGGVEALRRAGEQMADIRNALAHAGPPQISLDASRAAYHLDGDDDG